MAMLITIINKNNNNNNNQNNKQNRLSAVESSRVLAAAVRYTLSLH